MDSPLRILMTADPELPVPPRLYGGIERIVDLLVTGLIDRGHDVTLVAHRDSTTPAALVPYPVTRSGGAAAIATCASVVTRAAIRVRPDVIHSFGRVAYLAPLLPWSVPKIMSYQRAVTPSTVRWAGRISRHMTWAACSRHIAAPVDHLGTWRVIDNAVPVDRFRFAPRVPADAPLVFLGRIEEIKGVHLAIQVAREADRRLIIAGNVPGDAQSRAYFRDQVEPHIDGMSVVYAGPVDDEQKSRLLSECAALLMPILWDEPFGIVMVEALACGTPVIGLSRGAVPEVIDDGLTGFVCTDVPAMVAAVIRLGEVSRARCRQTAEVRFSQHALVDGYESLYRWVVGQQHSSARPAHQAAGA
jgi:glycosyltransferase involved in cell wall biosynthesis